jgi:transposase
VVRRHELTDQAWAEMAPLLLVNGRPAGSGPRIDGCSTASCGSWYGVAWRDLPERYGPWQTC